MMQKRPFFLRIWKKVLLSIIILILLVLGAAWYIGQRWNRQIQWQLKAYIQEMSDSLYTLRYADLNLNPITGSLTLEKVSLIRDPDVYKRLQEEQRAPKLIYSFTADEVSLSYFKVWRYFMKKELNAGSLVFSNPVVMLEMNLQNKDTTVRKNAYQNISSKIKSLYLGTLRLSNTNLKYTVIKKDSSLVMTHLENLRIQVKDFLIDSVALEDPTRFLYARNYEFGLEEYRYRTPDSLYWMHVKDIQYSAEEQMLRIGQFAVEPRYPRAEFDIRSKVQRDRFDVKLNNIELARLQPRMLLEHQVIWADKLTINNGTLDIYHNRKLPEAPGNKLGQFPNQLFKKLAIPIYIDSLVGKKTDIFYTEINPKSDEAGKLSIKQVHGIFRNVTNIDSMVAKNSHITADLNAILMNSGKLKVHFNFSMKDTLGGFGVSGQVKSMDGKDLNPVLKPLAMVQVKSCDIQDLSFSMTGNERRASGQVKFIYSNLKVNILKKEEGTHEFKRKGLMSFLANVLIIKDSNPADGETRLAHPRYERDIKKSFFNLVWKTLFTGIKETALGKNSPI
ncbi:hypothetical protein [Chitinophaga filiformis]|uniref:DUF748 domain-containing protein n=1 Tax=Chitinophaga filiformis TaxID=104663 RepID=A0ABY4I384_CHIFI|nr:hypothetical protein [Chitinophaga filiformis]UPK70080.1 hypothetical protein MYF79_02085 [Chitinophaga filiformis]